MRKLFGKIVILKDKESWPGIIYIYGSGKDSYGYERAMAIRGVKEKSPDQYGLPMIRQAQDFNIVKPTEAQCRNFIRNAFNAF
jgi:hypothetical protein